jgi:hypothetical protein
LSNTAGFADFKAPGQKPLVNSIFDFSNEALGELRLWLEQNPPATPVTSILGFSQFTAQTAVTAANQTRTSSTYADLATVGPAVTGLSPGNYLVLWGAAAFVNAATTSANTRVQDQDGNTTTNAVVAGTASTAYTSIMGADIIKLSKPNSSLTVKYSSSDNATQSSWLGRFLIVLRYSNL